MVFAAFLKTLKAGRHIEYLFAVLHRDNPPRGKAFAVTGCIDFINNRRIGVTGAQKIAVKAVTEHIFHRIAGRHQRLAEHLPTKYALALLIRALAAKQIDFKPLKLEQLQNRVE